MANTVKVMEVTDVMLSIFKTHPPTLYIHAEGLVPTPGYTNARLVPYVYVQFPPDGIWDFDFVADKPTGIVQQVISPVAASYMWHDFPAELKGVRIHASHNTIEKNISEHTPKELKSNFAKI